MGSFLNLDLMKNPANWITVLLMVLLGSMLVRFLFITNAVRSSAS